MLGGCSEFQGMGIEIFNSGIFGGWENLASIFWGWLDLSRDYLEYFSCYFS